MALAVDRVAQPHRRTIDGSCLDVDGDSLRGSAIPARHARTRSRAPIRQRAQGRHTWSSTPCHPSARLRPPVARPRMRVSAHGITSRPARPRPGANGTRPSLPGWRNSEPGTASRGELDALEVGGTRQREAPQRLQRHGNLALRLRPSTGRADQARGSPTPELRAAPVDPARRAPQTRRSRRPP